MTKIVVDFAPLHLSTAISWACLITSTLSSAYIA